MNTPRKMMNSGFGGDPTGIFRTGAAASLITSALVTAAVALYFRWPYAPERLPVEDILTLLSTDPLGGLMSLDISMVVIAPINMVVYVALYSTLREMNRPFATLALVSGSVALALLIVSRPILELIILAGKYARATTDSEKAIYAAISEGLLVRFSGTAWAVQTFLYLVSSLVFAVLMRKSPHFGKSVSALGIATGAAGFGFVVPKIGMIFLFLNTIGTIVWYSAIARCLQQIGRATQPQSVVPS